MQGNTSFCTVYEAGGNYAFWINFIAFWTILEYSWLLTHALHSTEPYEFYNFSSVISEGPSTKDTRVHLSIYLYIYNVPLYTYTCLCTFV